MPLPHFCSVTNDRIVREQDRRPRRIGRAPGGPAIRIGVARTGHWPGGGAAYRLPRPAPSGGGTFPTSGPADRFVRPAPRIPGAADDAPTRPVSRSIACRRNPRGEPASAIEGTGPMWPRVPPERAAGRGAGSGPLGSGPRSYP